MDNHKYTSGLALCALTFHVVLFAVAVGQMQAQPAGSGPSWWLALGVLAYSFEKIAHAVVRDY